MAKLSQQYEKKKSKALAEAAEPNKLTPEEKRLLLEKYHQLPSSSDPEFEKKLKKLANAGGKTTSLFLLSRCLLHVKGCLTDTDKWTDELIYVYACIYSGATHERNTICCKKDCCIVTHDIINSSHHLHSWLVP